MIVHLRERLWYTVLVLFLLFFTLVAGTAPSLDATLRLTSHIVLLGIVGSWLILRFVRWRGCPRTPLDLPLWAFLGAMALSTVFSINQRVSLELLLVNLLYALLFYAAVDLLQTDGALFRVIGATLLVAAVTVGVSLMELAGWYFGVFPSLGFEQGWPQIGGLAHPVPPVLRRMWLAMSVPNLLGAYLVLTLPLGIAVACTARSQIVRLSSAAWILLSLVVFFFTFSRGSWLALLVSLLVLLAPAMAYRRALTQVRALVSARWRALVGGALLVAVAVILVARPAAQAMGVRGTEQARLTLYRNALILAAERPVLGFGLGSFGQVNLERVSGTGMQSAVHGHAHNAYLNNLAEMGMVGTIALFWLLLAIARVAWRATKRADNTRARWLARAAAAGLVGSAAHDLVESPLDWPSILIPTILLVAILLELQRRSTSPSSAPGSGAVSWSVHWPRPLAAGLAIIGWVIIAAGLMYVGWAYLAYAEGHRAAAQSDWRQAAGSIATALVLDPNLVFYELELSFVEGYRALETGDGDALSRAIRGYESALAKDGSYALNHANLATLYWRVGKQEKAIAELQKASTLDSANALYNLNLGLYYEQLDQGDAAVRSYASALSRDLSLMRQSFWRASQVRRDHWPTIVGLLQQDVSPVLITAAMQAAPWGDAESFIAARRAAALVSAGNPSEALSILDQIVARQPGLTQARIERARAYLALKALDRAERDLRTAIFIDGSRLAHYYLGEVAVRRNDLRLAEQHFSRLAAVRAVPVGYGYDVYRRVGIPAQYLPGFIDPLFNDDLVEPALGVAAFFESTGRPERSVEIYRSLLDYDPDLASAREGLMRVLGP